MTQPSTRSRGNASKHSGTERSRAASQDAIALLKADHREVADWFEQFETARSDEKKARLAAQICQALKVHARIEEEIFYPAFLEATGNKDIHHEAEIEHDGAKRLIAQIEEHGPSDEYFESRVKVLSEMIKHHVKEEEQPEGMFAEARDSEMDLKALGEEMRLRKEELMDMVQPEGEVAFNG
jgi:hypothetical protein